MFKFLKKIFCLSEPYINTAEILADRQAFKQTGISNIPQPEPEIVDIPFIRKSLDELIWLLRDYDGLCPTTDIRTFKGLLRT